MKEINSKKSYTLLLLIVASTLLFSIVGNYWNKRYYHDEKHLHNVYAAAGFGNAGNP